jgi:hypothetical protein
VLDEMAIDPLEIGLRKDTGHGMELQVCQQPRCLRALEVGTGTEEIRLGVEQFERCTIANLDAQSRGAQPVLC